MIINCLKCGREFNKRSGKTTANKFCGRKCFHENRKNTDCGFIRCGSFLHTLTEKEQLDRLETYFNKHVIKQDGCWNWNGSLQSQGYTTLEYKKKPIKGHRASWMIHNGNIPKDLWVLHKCDNRKCTNPDHLFLGTAQDNVDDMIKKGRQRSKGKSGEQNPMAKLTADKVRKIRKLLNSSHSINSLTKKFHVCFQTICNIKYNYTWKDI